jgi:hypothetical protein
MSASTKEEYSMRGCSVQRLKRAVGSVEVLFATLLLQFSVLAPVAYAQTSPDVTRILTGSYAQFIAVDGSGNIFYTGSNSPTPTYTIDGVYELVAVNGVVPSNPTVRTLASANGSIGTPEGLAVDSQGDVYVVDHSDDSIKELVAVNGSVPTNAAIRTLITGVSFDDYNIAVDAHGNLYFDTLTTPGTDQIGELQELQAVNGSIPDNPTPVVLYTETLTQNCNCEGARVATPLTDAAGDVFFGDTGVFKELPATNGNITAGETPVSITLPPSTVALTVAPNGTFYIEAVTLSADDTFTDTIEAVVPVNGAYTTTPVVLYSVTGSSSPIQALGMVADNDGNIFIANKNSTVQDILEVTPGTGTSAAPQAALTPTTSDFGSLTVGTSSPAAVFTLANAGNAALSISSITLAGANASSFSVGSNTCGTMLAAGASCTVSVTFSPTSAGSAMAMLNIVDAVGTQASTLTGSGTAAAAPQAALSPSTADFGTVTVGATSAPMTFTLSNAGNAALGISSVSLGGTNAAAFSIATNACGSSLAAGASCAITVSFAPSLVGSEGAQLSVVDSVGTQSSGLSGTGGAAADFTVTASPDSQIVSAGNTAAYTVTVDSAGGTFTQAVALTATGLPPGATATFSPVQVTPGSAGAMSTMTVQTSVLSALAHSPAAPFAPMIAVFSCLPLCLRKRTSSRLRAVLGLIIIAGTMQGCGGGFALPGTSAQSENYTITVTGTSGTIQHSTQVQITVLKAAE